MSVAGTCDLYCRSCTVPTPPLILFYKLLSQASAHEDGQNKAENYGILYLDTLIDLFHSLLPLLCKPSKGLVTVINNDLLSPRSTLKLLYNAL
ncbi:hypothetical protein J6590_075311 [Homalodisca vitripennis]|nr:hypothetical protein J6590_075311 [Homalodisca vitripennis]